MEDSQVEIVFGDGLSEADNEYGVVEDQQYESVRATAAMAQERGLEERVLECNPEKDLEWLVAGEELIC